MKEIVVILFFISLIACNNKNANTSLEERSYTDLKTTGEKDYLVAVGKDGQFELGMPFAFVDTKGDTVIPFGKYSHCWTDTLKTFAIVYDETDTNAVTVAIDRNENVLFDVYFYDNWPDEPIEGLFRVKRNDLIGFANEIGEIIIPCQFECASEFEEGKAKVARHCTLAPGEDEHRPFESDEWIYIDKNGTEVK